MVINDGPVLHPIGSEAVSPDVFPVGNFLRSWGSMADIDAVSRGRTFSFQTLDNCNAHGYPKAPIYAELSIHFKLPDLGLPSYGLKIDDSPSEGDGGSGSETRFIKNVVV